MYNVVEQGRGTFKDVLNYMSSLIEHIDDGGKTHKFDILVCADINDNQCYVVKYPCKNTLKALYSTKQLSTKDNTVITLKVLGVYKCEDFGVLISTGLNTNETLTVYYCK